MATSSTMSRSAAGRSGPARSTAAARSAAGNRPGPARPASAAPGPRPAMLFSVPGGPGGDGPGAVRSVRAHGGVDLGRAGGVHFPGFFRDAGDGPAPEAARGPGVGLDAVAELDRLGRRRHPSNGRGGMEVVARQGRCRALSSRPVRRPSSRRWLPGRGRGPEGRLLWWWRGGTPPR